MTPLEMAAELVRLLLRLVPDHQARDILAAEIEAARALNEAEATAKFGPSP